jgi:hypothetical protein
MEEVTFHMDSFLGSTSLRLEWQELFGRPAPGKMR